VSDSTRGSSMLAALNRFRALLGGPFDRPAPAWLIRAIGAEPPPAMDLGRIELIRRADADSLRDSKRLEALLPDLGINADAPHLFPPELRTYLGQGLRYWQYPCQLAPYLALLSSVRIERYLELGVQHGGTFVLTTEYLDRFQPIKRAVAVDVQRVRAATAYRRIRPAARFVTVDSGTRRFRRLLEREGPFDLVLIDGDHARDAVRRDWETVRPHAWIVAFHDIVDSLSPGVAAVWAEVKREHARDYSFYEFVDQYPDVHEREGRTFLGIGVAVRSPGTRGRPRPPC
jgi:predicted O-methyltransferase YrrM